MTRFQKIEDFIVHQNEPFNGGTPVEKLGQSFITPNSQFYVRSHAPVPEINGPEFRLKVGGLVSDTLVLSLDELKQRFPERTVTATLQCAGNRRKEFEQVAPMPGESVIWGNEAISTAEWTGIALRDVLQEAGFENRDDLHVAFVSIDRVEKDGETFGYGGSIPLSKALQSEVLLAYMMNGAVLPAVHGYPLRVIVPGYVAARSVKWLGEIIVQDHPSENYYQAKDYKRFPPHIDESTVDWSSGEMLGEMQPDAVITSHVNDEVIEAGDVEIRGYVIDGDSANMQDPHVEVSIDGEKTWIDARFFDRDEQWAWRFWRLRVSIPPGEHTLSVKLKHVQQPDSVEEIWNFKGYMNNSIHRVRIRAE